MTHCSKVWATPFLLLLLLAGCATYLGKANVERKLSKGDYDGARKQVAALREAGVFGAADVERLRREINRREAPVRLRSGLEHLANGRYSEAIEDLRFASSFTHEDTSLRQIIDALCIAKAHLALDEKARATCETARTMGADTSKILSRVYQQLASKYAAEIDKALASGEAAQARSNWRHYESLPTGDRARLRSWDKRITSLEREIARSKAAAEQARSRALQQQYYADLKVAIAHVSRKWGVVRGWTKDEFIFWLSSQRTVLGAPIFSNVEIPRRDRLELWLNNSETLGPNLSHFADFADAFSVWCNCDGLTSIGIDARHLPGGSRIIMYYFRLNLSTARSQMSAGPSRR